jgi:hypothetical protein
MIIPPSSLIEEGEKKAGELAALSDFSCSGGKVVR